MSYRGEYKGEYKGEPGNEYIRWLESKCKSKIDDFETEITTVNENKKSVKCRLVFKKVYCGGDGCTIYIYDSDGRFFQHERISVPIDYYYNLMLNNQFNLCYSKDWSTTIIQLQGVKSIFDKMCHANCVYENNETNVNENFHFRDLLHKKKELYKQINEINKQMTLVKNEYAFKNNLNYRNVNVNVHECDMCYKYFHDEKLHKSSMFMNEYHCYNCSRKNIIAKKCVKCSKEESECFELIVDIFNDYYCFNCYNCYNI